MSESLPPEQESQVDYAQLGVFYCFWARAFSLLSALVLSIILFVMPHLVAEESTEIDYRLLLMYLWGLSAAYVHGVGFVPRMLVWRWLLGPWLAWPLMALGIYTWCF